MNVENTLLQRYFPMLRTRDEVLMDIKNSPVLSGKYFSRSVPWQEGFLDFATAVRGLKPLYDSFFKEIFNVESSPERLENFLSLLLGQEIHILTVLPNDNNRIAAENTLLITDIIVQLTDGSLANVEIQKRGYDFPGQRSACYSVDLLLRQYKRVHSEKGKSFIYQDIKDVYCVVLFENSPREFADYPDIFIHRARQTTDTGLELDLLQKYVFIPLDIFSRFYHNNGIRNKLDAWLAFLSQDKPEDVIAIIERYPEFQPLYEQLYQICRNVEDIMGFFSDELRILDENTVQYMMDEQQKQLEQQQERLKQQREQLEEQQEQLEEQQEHLEQQQEQLAHQKEQLAHQKEQLAHQKERLEQQLRQIEQQKEDNEAAREKARLAEAQAELLQQAILKSVSAGNMSVAEGLEALQINNPEILRRRLEAAGFDAPEDLQNMLMSEERIIE